MNLNASTFRVFTTTIRSSVCSLYNSQISSHSIKYKNTLDAYNFVREYSCVQTSNSFQNGCKTNLTQKFLQPVQLTMVEQPSAGMKLVNDPKRRCKHCYIVIEDERKYVFCDKYPRHKQAAVRPGPKFKVSRIMTHATQGGTKSSARMGMWTQQGLREDY